jgi:mono/diheme cytochrome c family protein
MIKSRYLVWIVVGLVLFAFVLSLISFGRNPQTTQNSSTNRSTNRSAAPSTTENIPTNKSEPPMAPRSIGTFATPDVSKNTWDLPADADKTKNPVAATEESIAQGKELFMTKEKGNCIFCHGETGSGNKANLPRLRRVPADLSDSDRMPKLSDGEIFWKMTRGIPGIMPSRETELTEEERWQVVNFVRTLAVKKSPAN